MKKSGVAFLGLFTAYAMILSFVESQIPSPTNGVIPGVKLGLPNIAIIIVLYRFGFKEALIVSMLRVLLTSLLFGNFESMLFSIAGAFLSFMMMLLLKNAFDIVTVSIVGAVSHNVGQIFMAIFITDTPALLSWLPALMITGVIAGVLVGLVASTAYKRIVSLQF